MSNGQSLINIGELSKPATVLVEQVSQAVGGLFKPWQIRRTAGAEADAEKIAAMAKIEITDLHRRALHRAVEEETVHQANMEKITALALPDLAANAEPEKIERDWLTDLFQKCRFVTNEEMQRLWARILAGEANKPGQFSRRTLSNLASLGKVEAEAFTQICRCTFKLSHEGTSLRLIYLRNLTPEDEIDPGIEDLLEEAGLVRPSNRPRQDKCTMFDAPLPSFSYYGESFRMAQGPLDYFRSDLHFTQSGAELAAVCETTALPGYLGLVLREWLLDDSYSLQIEPFLIEKYRLSLQNLAE